MYRGFKIGFKKDMMGKLVLKIEQKDKERERERERVIEKIFFSSVITVIKLYYILLVIYLCSDFKIIVND